MPLNDERQRQRELVDTLQELAGQSEDQPAVANQYRVGYETVS